MLKFQNIVSAAVIAPILSVWTLSVVQYSEKNTTFWKLNLFPSTHLIRSDRNSHSEVIGKFITPSPEPFRIAVVIYLSRWLMNMYNVV